MCKCGMMARVLAFQGICNEIAIVAYFNFIAVLSAVIFAIVDSMNILITGSSGLIGQSLYQHFEQHGHQVFRMSRTQRDAPFYWQATTTNQGNTQYEIQWDDKQHIDAVIHLAGESLGRCRWSKAKKQRIYNSRIDSTQALVAKMQTLKNPPKTLLSASAIGYYGEGGTKTFTETDTAGQDFLAQLAANWETAANLATRHGIRVVNLRTGLVLSPNGGALAAMLPAFRRGMGGKLGNGQQYMSWVSLAEITHMIDFLLHNETAHGAFNLVSRYPVTNSEFTATLAGTLKRSANINMPVFAVKALFGEMGQLLLLNSIKVAPDKLAALGYSFTDEDLSQTFANL